MKARVDAFRHALRGAITLVATQPNAKFHVGATVAVLVLGFFCRVTTFEWALLVFSIAIVWLAEGVNTAIEFLADEVSLERRERIKHAKDVAAFSVLAASVASATIGALIFVPYFAGNR